MKQTRALSYGCAPTITWVKDAKQTILVEEDSERSWSLRGMDAVVWDLLTLNYRFGKIANFLAVLYAESEEAAAANFLSTLRRWEKEGIVAVNGRGSDG